MALDFVVCLCFFWLTERVESAAIRLAVSGLECKRKETEVSKAAEEFHQQGKYTK